MFSLLSTDLLRLICNLLSTTCAKSLLSTCTSIQQMLDTLEYWKSRMLQRLRIMECVQTGKCIMDWNELLQTDTMSASFLRDTERRLCTASGFEFSHADEHEKIMRFVIDADNSEEECLGEMTHFIKKRPNAFFHSHLVPCGFHKKLMLGLVLSHDMEVNLAVSHISSNQSVIPLSEQGFQAVLEKELGWDTLPRKARFKVTYIHPLNMKARSHTIVNLAFIFHLFKRNMSKRLIGSAPPTFDRIFSAVLAIPHERRNCIDLYLLRAIDLDDLSKMKDALRYFSPAHFHDASEDVTLSESWAYAQMCLCFQASDNVPRMPYYVATSSGSHVLKRYIATELGLSVGIVYWDTFFPPDLHKRFFLTSLSLFMLYTSKICPTIYNWWIRNCPSYSESQVEKMRNMIRKIGLPPIECVPVGSRRMFLCVE